MRKILAIIALAVLLQSSLYPLTYAQEFTTVEELGGSCSYVRIVSLSDSARERLLELVVEDIDELGDPTKEEKTLSLTKEQREILNSTMLLTTGNNGFVKQTDMDVLIKPIPRNHSLLQGDFVEGLVSFLIELKGSLLICNRNGVCRHGGNFSNDNTVLPPGDYSVVENYGRKYTEGEYHGIVGSMNDISKVFVAGWSRVKFAQMLTGNTLAFWTDVIYGALQIYDLGVLGFKGARHIAKWLGGIKELDPSVKSILKDIVAKEPKKAEISLGKIISELPKDKELSTIEKRLDDLKKGLEEISTREGTNIVDLEVTYLSPLEKHHVEGAIEKVLEESLRRKGIRDKEKIKKIIKEEFEKMNARIEDFLKKVNNDLKLKTIKEELDKTFPNWGPQEKKEFLEIILKDIQGYKKEKIGDLIDEVSKKIKEGKITDTKAAREAVLELEGKLKQNILEDIEYLKKNIPSGSDWKTRFLDNNEFILKGISKDTLEAYGIDIRDNNNLYDYFKNLLQDQAIKQTDDVSKELDNIIDKIKTNNPWAKLSEAYDVSTARKAIQVWRTTLGRKKDPFFHSELLTHAVNERASSFWSKLLLSLINPDISKKFLILSRGALAFGSWGMILGHALTNPTTIETTGIVFNLEKTGRNDSEKMVMVMSKDYASIQFIPTEDFIETFMTGFFQGDALTWLLNRIGEISGLGSKKPEELYNTFYNKLNKMGKYLLLHDDITPVYTTSKVFQFPERLNEIAIENYTVIYHQSQNPVYRIVLENPLNYLKKEDTYISAILLYTSKIDTGMISNITYGTTPAETMATWTGLGLDVAKLFLVGGWVYGTFSKGLDKISLTTAIATIPIKIAIIIDIIKYVVPGVSSSYLYWVYKEDVSPAPSCEEVLKNTQVCVELPFFGTRNIIDKYTFFNLVSIGLYCLEWGTGGTATVPLMFIELGAQKAKEDFVRETWMQLSTCYEDKYYMYGISEIPISEKNELKDTLNSIGLGGLFEINATKEKSIQTQIDEFLSNLVDYPGAFKYQPAHLRLVTIEKDFSIYKLDRIYALYFSPDSEITNIGKAPIEAKVGKNKSLVFRDGKIVEQPGNKTVFEGPQAYYRKSDLKRRYFAIGNKVIEISLNKDVELMRFENDKSWIDDCVQKAMEKLGVLNPTLNLEFLSTDEFDIINVGDAYKIVFHKDVPELDLKKGGFYETKSGDSIVIKRDGSVKLKITGVKTFTAKLKNDSRIRFDKGSAYILDQKIYLFIPEIYTTNINEFTEVRMVNTQNETGMHIGLHTGDPKVDAWTKHIDAVYKGEKNCTERIDYKNNQLIISCSDGTKDVYNIIGLESSCVLLEKEGQKYVYTFQMLGNQIYNFIAPGESCADASPEKAVFGPYPISYLWTPNGMVVFNPDTGKVELRNEFAFPLNPAFNYYGGLLQGNSFVPSPNPLGYTPNVDNRKPSGTSGPLIIPSVPEGIYGILFLFGAGIVMILGHTYLSKRFRNKQSNVKKCK